MKLLLFIGQKCLKLPLLGNFLSSMFEFIIRIVYSSDISCKAEIPNDIEFIHGHDIVIGCNVKIGKNCKIFNGVTLGNKNIEILENHQPRIGNNCVLSTGAKILGEIDIGDNCIVGANAVVIQSVPSNCLAVGVPARIVPRKL